MLNRTKILRRSENVSILMQQVQACSWCTFKLNEIVTLERCLQEATIEDPSIGLFIRKLVNESIFVEPAKKLRHLTRDDKEKRIDSDLRTDATQLCDEIERKNKDIELYRRRLNDLSQEEQETSLQIAHIKQSTLLVENAWSVSYEKFKLVFELVINSFERPLSLIAGRIPEYLLSLPQCKLVKQLDQVPIQYRKLLIKLVRDGERYQQNEQLALKFRYSYLKCSTIELKNYLKAITTLLKDLVLIHKVYKNEIPKEIESSKSLEARIESLKKPPIDLPKKITVLYSDLNPCEQPQITVSLPDSSEDVEIQQLFGLLSGKLK